MKWPRIKVRVREPSPLQKPRASPRFKTTQLRQEKQRLKTFLPFNQARKKSLFLQPKSEAGVGRIRFLVRQNLDFIRRRVSRVCGFGFLIADTIHTCSIAARARLWIWRLCFFFSPIAGTIHTCSIAARASMWIWRFCFFFSPISDAIHTCSIVAGARLRIYRSRGLLFIVSF